MNHIDQQPTPEIRVLRAVSNMLCIHGLCGRRACRRARACHGEPRDCLHRYARLVPEDAREGAKAMAWAGRRGLCFDDLLDDARDDVLALADWANAITASYRRSVLPDRQASDPRVAGTESAAMNQDQ
ncbi:MAG: hypothetical protein AB7E84_20440 [Xanthobacteraceae bacterium]